VALAPRLAQLNIATLLQPIDHPATADFADALDMVNAIAESSPGFVWRLKDDSNNATSFTLDGNPLNILNMSVWDDVTSLRDFVYRGTHVEFFKRRGEWFDPARTRTAMWWITDDQLPSLDDAAARLRYLDRYAPGPYAFQMGHQMPRLVIHPTDLHDDVAIQLIARLNNELAAMYPQPGANHFSLGAEEVADGRGVFLVAHLDDVAVGCAALRQLDQSTSEVKRMYVDPAARGNRIGAALLCELERVARSLGASAMVLETGAAQAEAVGLYDKHGFVRCPCWGEYLASPDTSLCYRLELTRQ
jgi:GNAT superfamily N-acetyltransferase